MIPWLVCDMDEGVLRREPTRKAALRWSMNHLCASRVLERYAYGRGSYDYLLGDGGGDSAGGVSIVRADVAARSGWKPDQAALYPVAGDPFEEVARPAGEGGEPV